jgi:hypothetical protein
MVAVAAVGCGDDDRPPLMRDAGGADTSIPGVDSGPPGCTPGQYACAGSTRYLCGEDGMSRLNEEVCPAACSPTEGCIACMPGQRQCDGTVSMVCAPDGSGFVSGRDCAEFGSTCGSSGFCADACAEAESTRSNVGCEYWAVPMANPANYTGGRYDFRVVAANPSSEPANVRVFRGTSMVASVTVAGNGLEAIVLPWIIGMSDAFEDGPATSLATRDGGYRILSDRPVTVWQFNPFDYDNGRTIRDPITLVEEPDYSYSNDASLLLPVHSFTGRYIGSSYVPVSRTVDQPGLLFGRDRSSLKTPGYIVLVGVTPEPTQVNVAVSAPVAAEPGGKFGATSRGGVLNFTLQRGEVVHVVAAAPVDCASGRPGFSRESLCAPDAPGCDVWLETCNEAEFDLTGTTINANHPIAAFGGHACAYVPYNAQACDHLESQLPPVETWGVNYNSGPLFDPSGEPNNVVRVTAALDDTQVTVTPPQSGTSTMTLSAGQWSEFIATSAFQLTATRGVMVTQYLVGQQASGAERGDPSMVILPPREQYRRDYTFVAPTSYNSSTDGQSYILVIRSPGQSIMLDGAAINPTWATGGERETGLVPISGGTHQMESSEPFGVIVFGMGITTSYAYPAGLNLEEILLI